MLILSLLIFVLGYIIVFTLFWRGLYCIRIFLKILRYVIVLCTSCKLGVRCSHPVSFGKMLWRYTQALGDRAAEYCETEMHTETCSMEGRRKMHLRVYKKCRLLISHAEPAGAGSDAFGFSPRSYQVRVLAETPGILRYIFVASHIRTLFSMSSVWTGSVQAMCLLALSTVGSKPSVYSRTRVNRTAWHAVHNHVLSEGNLQLTLRLLMSYIQGVTGGTDQTSGGYNPKHLYPKLNGYGDNGKRSLKLW